LPNEELSYQIKENELEKECGSLRKKIAGICIQSFGIKSEGKRRLGRHGVNVENEICS
jgi:hypothetical protein